MHPSTHPVDVSHLAAFDVDGAVREAAERLGHADRRGFLRGCGITIAGGALGALLPATAWAAGLDKRDRAILNYALTLEYLQSAFYDEALKHGALTGDYKRYGAYVARHEATHVQTLRNTLGSAAVKMPAFDFQGTTSDQAAFARTATTLEEAGVKAYQGQAPNISSPAVLKAAMSIHPVEARHTAWIRNIQGLPPAPQAFNPAAGMSATLATINDTGFVLTAGGAKAGKAVPGTPAMTG